MYEEDIITWIGGPGASIKKSGELNEKEVACATVAYLKNGNKLLHDARFLITNKRIERGTALTILALEELAKIKILTETFLHHAHGVDEDAWKKYWKTGGNHKTKQEQILSYGKIVRASFDGDLTHQKYLYRHYAPDQALEKLDWLKQSSLYVDIRDDGIHEPSSNEYSIKATDYLLTFAQERADSYMSWHISPQRTLDQLSVALGKQRSQKWTHSYKKSEVYSDILYQCSALSASLIPNYAVFNDFIRKYLQNNVAKKRVEEAILTLAADIRLRIQESKELPIYQSRYIGAYKLLFGISELSGLFSSAFNKELMKQLELKSD